MSDPHRLAELERQRALIAAHLKWLDEQIAHERHGCASPQSSAAQPLSAAHPLSTAASAELPRTHELAGAGNLSAGYPARPSGVEVQALPLQDADPLPSKSGCWIAFTAMMVGLATAVGLFIYFRYGRGP